MVAAAAATAPRVGLDSNSVAARMAANNAVKFELGKAFASGRSNLLPFLAPRPNTATSAASLGLPMEGAGDIPHKAPEPQHQTAGSGQQEGGHSTILQAHKAGEPVETVQKREKSVEANKLLEIPPVGTPMPSMENMQLTDVAHKFIHPHDVLCGRGGGTNNHPGNEAFRDLVTAQKVVYLHASKRDKPFVSRGIVRAIRSQNPPGRFLQKNEQTGLWFDIGDQKAREKTSQALREGAPEIRREIETSGNTPPRTMVPPGAFPFAGQATYSQSELAAAGNGHHGAQSELPANKAAHQVAGKPGPPVGGSFGGFQTPNAMPPHAQISAARAIAWATQHQRRYPPMAPVHNQLIFQQQRSFQGMPRAPLPNIRVGTSQGVLVRDRGVGLIRDLTGPARILAGGRLAPMSVDGLGSKLRTDSVDKSKTLAPQPTLATQSNKRSRSAMETDINKTCDFVTPHDSQAQARNVDDRVGLLPHDCARRLALAEAVAQKTVNGTLPDNLKAEDYRLSLYLDAGLLGIDPADIARSLAHGQTESDIVEESYKKLLKTSKHDELFPRFEKVPITKGSLEALGALNKEGIHDALQSIGMAPAAEVE